MGGKRDKKKKSKDPLKKAALAAKKEAKADKAALKRLQREQDRLSSLSVHDDDHSDGDGGGKQGKKGGKGKSAPDDLDSLLESYKRQTRELATAELEPIETPFPRPPRGNFTWTLCPSNGMFYMFGGEYYDGAENLVFDELLRWDPDAKQQSDSDDDDEEGANGKNDEINTGQWTRILTPPPRPPPRCAHSTVHHNDALYVFGGECATAEKYHHYKDLWRFDVKQNAWEECRSRGGAPPAARSGHRAVAWRHYMILFGGFHEALRAETRWFNDVHVFDFQTATWTELKYGKLARVPPPRSACNMSICTSPTEALFVYGGYSKVKNANAPGASRSEGIMHVDCWTLPLKSLVSGGKGGPLNGANPPSWERIARKGEYPSARAGASAILHKNKMLLYGGVMDNEGDHHKMDSVFYDDLFALDMERRRWFSMRLKKAATGGRRRRRKKGEDGITEAGIDNAINGEDGEEDESDDDLEEEEVTTNEEAQSSGWDLDQLRHDMFAFIDAEGNVVFEKIEAEEGDGEGKGKEDDEEMTSTTKQTDVSEDTDATGDGNNSDVAVDPHPAKPSASSKAAPQAPKIEKIAASSVMKVDDTGLPTAVARQTPLPRINCASVVRNNTLYIYGGVLEVGDREVTLDDCWSIDLNKRDKWTCIWSGQMHRQVWRGVDSDNDSYISSDQAGDDDEDSDDGMAEFEPILEGEQDEEESEEARKKAKKAAKKAKEKEKRRGIRHEVAELKEKLGVDNEQRTPLMGETVADFYARTTELWNVEAANSVGKAAADRGEALSTKELKREGFHLAKERYEELAPILDRLNELEAAQAESEDKRAKKKAEKKPRKDRKYA